MPAIATASPAPDFALPNQHKEVVQLTDLRGQYVVLFFYPKDDTSGCTAEACRFRDEFERFSEAGAQVIGVSDDSPESHRKFISRYNLPFTLLSDKEGRVRKLYGVKKTFGLIPGRVTFIIDRGGIVRHVFSSQSSPTKHVDEALAELQRLG